MNAQLVLMTGAGALALGLATLHPADAAVLSNVSNSALSSTPTTISLGGAAGLAFTSVNTGNGPGAWVATTGTAMVTTIFGGLSDFFAGSTIDGTGLYSFAGYPTPTQIPNSAADDYIGLSFSLSDGTHYGYAEVFGPTLVGYGYETSPGTTILTGAMGGMAPGPITGGGTGGGGTGGGGTGGGGTGGGGTGGGGTGGGGTGGGGTGGGGGATATPEPASAALLLTGLAALTLRRRRSQRSAPL